MNYNEHSFVHSFSVSLDAYYVSGRVLGPLLFAFLSSQTDNTRHHTKGLHSVS